MVSRRCAVFKNGINKKKPLFVAYFFCGKTCPLETIHQPFLNTKRPLGSVP